MSEKASTAVGTAIAPLIQTFQLTAAKVRGPPTIPNAVPARWRVNPSREWPEGAHSEPPPRRVAVRFPQGPAAPSARLRPLLRRYSERRLFTDPSRFLIA